MAAKLGLPAPDPELVDDLLELLRAQRVDFTSFFRALVGRHRAVPVRPSPSRSTPGPPAARRCCPRTGPRVAAAMDRVNPVYIPRNHLVEEALTAATAGDLAPFRRLVDVVSEPYEERPGLDDYARPAPAGCAPYVTYCGT